jgi:hypothetical protein
VRRVLDGKGAPVSVHPDEDEAARHLGRMLLADGGIPAGTYAVHTVPAPGLERPVRSYLVDPASPDQYVADLAAVLGLNKARRWSEMCREVRDQRHRLEALEAHPLVDADPERLDPEALERALRAHWDAHRVTEAWENAPGPDQERELRAVERILRAYLAPAED